MEYRPPSGKVLLRAFRNPMTPTESVIIAPYENVTDHSVFTVVLPTTASDFETGNVVLVRTTSIQPVMLDGSEFILAPEADVVAVLL
jgi:co-chaperonin GroES (HSP10)